MKAVVIDAGWHPLANGTPPEWASGWGQDRDGVWVALSVSDVTQRLRWITPGRFTMGSHPGELGQYLPHHEVKLAFGFWLFDRPCTQALWEAVTGKNPSKFRSPTRPVEQVSFTDVQTFLAELNGRIPGLDLVLPSEAQWEYACRAGNPWGLHHMPGNVWEWCADHWHESYDGAPRDGSAWLEDRGSSIRVIRGHAARSVRAGYRQDNVPDNRDDGVGFRCARLETSYRLVEVVTNAQLFRATRQHQILGLADEFLSANPLRPVYVDDLCNALGVSTSVLDEAFKDEFGMSPHRYLKLRRMSLVRAALLSPSSPWRSVKAAFLLYGFWHLGQAAQDYRKIFGELPSATLARAEKERDPPIANAEPDTPIQSDRRPPSST